MRPERDAPRSPPTPIVSLRTCASTNNTAHTSFTATTQALRQHTSPTTTHKPYDNTQALRQHTSPTTTHKPYRVNTGPTTTTQETCAFSNYNNHVTYGNTGLYAHTIKRALRELKHYDERQATALTWTRAKLYDTAHDDNK